MGTTKKYLIYRHSNKINGGIYIGQTCLEPIKRWGTNGEGYKKCPYFYRAIKKYGWDNFEHDILFESFIADEIDDKEQWWISYYKNIPNQIVYNLDSGGSVNKTHSKETRQKISNSLKGHKQSQEAKEKISKANKGRLSGKNNPNYGKHLSVETRKKIANANMGRTHSEEVKKKFSEMRQGKKHPRALAILQYSLDGNFINKWDYIRQASNALGVDHSNISACCKGKQKTAYGYVWEYADQGVSK